MILSRNYKDHDEKYINMNRVRTIVTNNILVISCLAIVSVALIIHQSLSSSSTLTTESQQQSQPRSKLLSSTASAYNIRSAGGAGHGARKAAIAVLCTNSENDMRDFCYALQSLKNLRGGDSDSQAKAPVLVFNEGDLYAEQMRFLRQCTDRPMLFPIVQLNGAYPARFDPEKEFEISTKFGVLGGRDKWSYSQMIRFWTTNMWKHPAVQQFETIMRIDTDSCFLDQNGELRNEGYNDLPFLSSEFVYQSNYNGDVGNPKYPEYIAGLYDFTVAYMKKVGMTPSNPELWAIIQNTWEDTQNLPVFQTNFEVTRKSFYQRADVAQWHESLTEIEPFGVFRHRWGDAQTRALTAAMFGTKESVMLTRSVGYKHGRGRCKQLIGDLAVIPERENIQRDDNKKEDTEAANQKAPHPAGTRAGPPATNPSSPNESNRGAPESQQKPNKAENWPKGVAWLMTFPNSGTMFTTDLVTKVSKTATGTNYGNELRKRTQFNYMTTPGFQITSEGPFRYSSDPLPNGYLLTKTHCAGYCTECPPNDYLIDAERFARQCATGVKDKPGGGNIGVRYNFDIVTKAVHMYRNPFDNAVALFHNQYKVHERQNDDKWSYTYDRDGFWKWCKFMDSEYVKEEEGIWDKEYLAASKGVPCRAAFYQYVQWHNNALRATKELNIPTLTIYYEDFHYDMEGQIKKITDFLELPITGETLPFKWGGGYTQYFSDEERAKIVTFLNVMSDPANRDLLMRYTNYFAISNEGTPSK